MRKNFKFNESEYARMTLASPERITATSLSKAMNNEISHDSITRILSKNDFTKILESINFKEKINEHTLNGVWDQLYDDVVIDKKHSKETSISKTIFSKSDGKYLNAISLVVSVITNGKHQIPVNVNNVEYIEKYSEKKKKNLKVSRLNKNILFRAQVKSSLENKLKIRYHIADKFYTTVENIVFMKNLNAKFILPLKENRKFKYRKNGLYYRIDQINLEENSSKLIYLKGIPFAVKVFKVIVKNGDALNTIYFISNDFSLSVDKITDIYKKRWGIENVFRNLKSNTALEKCFCYAPKNQLNHIFLTFKAYAEAVFNAIENNKSIHDIIAYIRNEKMIYSIFISQSFLYFLKI